MITTPSKPKYPNEVEKITPIPENSSFAISSKSIEEVYKGGAKKIKVLKKSTSYSMDLSYLLKKGG